MAAVRHPLRLVVRSLKAEQANPPLAFREAFAHHREHVAPRLPQHRVTGARRRQHGRLGVHPEHRPCDEHALEFGNAGFA